MMVLLTQLFTDVYEGRPYRESPTYVNPSYVMILTSTNDGNSLLLFPGEDSVMVKGDITEVYKKLFGP